MINQLNRPSAVQIFFYHNFQKSSVNTAGVENPKILKKVFHASFKCALCQGLAISLLPWSVRKDVGAGPQGSLRNILQELSVYGCCFWLCMMFLFPPKPLGWLFQGQFLSQHVCLKDKSNLSRDAYFFGMFFTSCTMSLVQDNSCSYHGLGCWRGDLLHLIYLKGKENLAVFPKTMLIYFIL